MKNTKRFFRLGQKVKAIVAEFTYDALGRRVRKIDSVAGETTLYYNNHNWQVLI